MPICVRNPARAAAFLLVLVCVAVAATPTAASAQQAPTTVPKLGIQPADQPEAWYDLELDAGGTEQLSVELANHGDEPLTVATYAADIYSLVGGGMGVALRDEATSGTTRWLDYRPTTALLGPDEAVRRTVTVTVPDDTEPGQYLAALVIENDQPIAAEGDLAVEHIVRQAIAVNITVPGPAAPALNIGDVEHIATGERSVARLEVDNTGNRHLKPAGNLTLTDAAGTRLASVDVAMDSVYAGTTGHLEIGVEEPLPPGVYTVAADLRDSEHDIDASGTASFEVVAPPLTDRLVPGLDRVMDSIEATGLPPWIILSVTGLLLALLLVLLAGVARRRRAGRSVAEPRLTPLPVADAAADRPPTVPSPRPAPPLFSHANVEAPSERERAPRVVHAADRQTARRVSGPDESAPPRRTAAQSASAASLPHRRAEPAASSGAPASRSDRDGPASATLFTARPPSRRRRRRLR